VDGIKATAGWHRPAAGLRFDHVAASQGSANGSETLPTSELTVVDPSVDPTSELARCFLRLANLPNYALDGLNRYEATLWRTRRVLTCKRLIDELLDVSGIA
jgi:hypothetical protein